MYRGAYHRCFTMVQYRVVVHHVEISMVQYRGILGMVHTDLP